MPLASTSPRSLARVGVLAIALIAAANAPARPSIVITSPRGGFTAVGAVPAPSEIHPIYDNFRGYYWPPVVRNSISGSGHTFFQVHYRRYGQFYYAFPPYWWLHNRGYWYTHDARRWGWTYEGPPVVGMPVWRDPAEMEAERQARAAALAAEQPVIEIDEALLALRARDYHVAAAIYRARSEPRHQALALVGAGELPRAVEVFARAYTAHPEFLRQPMNALGLLGTRAEMRKLVNRAVRHANRTDTAEAWFTVAVLMQGEGRDELARQMIDRAREAEALGRGTVPRPAPLATQPAAAPTPAPRPIPGTLVAPQESAQQRAPAVNTDPVVR